MTHQKDHYRRVNGKTIYVPDAEEASEQAEGREVAKAHVKGHVRIVDGKVILIAAHETKAPGRVAKLHERTALGEHKTKGNYLRAMDKDDAATIGKVIERVTGRKAEKWSAKAKHHGEEGTYAHFQVKDAEEGAKILAELAQTHEADEEVPQGLFEEGAQAAPSFQDGECLPFNQIGAFLHEHVYDKKKGEIIPNPTFEVGKISPEGIAKINQFIPGFNEDFAKVRVSGRALKHAGERHPDALRLVASKLPEIVAHPQEVLHNPKRPNSAFLVYKDKQNVMVVLEVAKNGTGSDIVNLITHRPNTLEKERKRSAEWLGGRSLPIPAAEGDSAVSDKFSDVQPSSTPNVVPLEDPGKPEAQKGPKEGDERQVNGRTYRMVDGRWHRVGKGGQLQRLGKDGWEPKGDGEAPAAEEPTPEEPASDPETPKDETNGPAAIRQRLSIEEPEGTDFDKKYGISYVLKDGERVAKVSKWHRTTDGVALFGINDLKYRKARPRFGSDPGQLVTPCESLDDALDKYAMDLYSQEQDRLAKESQKNDRGAQIKAHKKATALANATPATRAEVTRALVDEEETPQDVPAPEPYAFTPGKAPFSRGGIMQDVPDFTEAIPLKMTLANRKTILEDPRPSYIPAISDDWFTRMSNRLEGVKVGDDRYLITTERPRGERMGAIESMPGAKQYALVNLAGLVATQDYYAKRQKAKLDQELAKAQVAHGVTASIMTWFHQHPEQVNDLDSADLQALLPDLTEDQRKMASGLARRGMNEFRVFARGKTLDQYLVQMKKDLATRVKKKMPKTIGSDKMTYSHQSLIGTAFPEAKGRLSWEKFHEFNNDLKQAASDMEIQMEETASSYSKGKETAYGRGGAVKDLFESHGVVVKRQNGDEITPMEVEEVKKALDDVFSVIGDRSAMAKRTGLLISHAGIMLQHARKAVGLYMPSRTAIGVSWTEGAKEAGFTMAHEFAHYMDNHLGKLGGRNHYASDDRNGLEYRIADTFRKKMAALQSSAYMNRTCECFARAMEQYFGAVTGKPLANSQGNHPTHDDFAKHVQPLIAEFLATRGPILKALQDLPRPA